MFLFLNLAVLICMAVEVLPGQIKQVPLKSFIRPSNKEVLASVGGKIITVQDFQERSEFTVRPDNYKNKNSALNNLILEKILALEAEQASNHELSSGLQATLDGIKE